MTKENRAVINESALNKIGKLVKSATSILVSGEVEGILKKPTSSREIEEFNGTVNEILLSKLRKKLGV